jgi:Tetratricopeptide repeat
VAGMTGLIVASILTLGLLEASAQQRGALRGPLSPDATTGAFQGPVRPGGTTGLFRGHTTSEVTKGALRGSVLPGATTGAFREPIPSGVAAGTLTTPPESLPSTDQAKLLEGHVQMSLTDGALAEAETFLTRLLRMREEALGPEHPDVAETLEKYADLLRRRDRPAEAEALAARAQEIRAKQGQ